MTKPVHNPEGDMDKQNIQQIFHRCWTHAVDSLDYDKSEWKELRVRLKDCGVVV